MQTISNTLVRFLLLFSLSLGASFAAAQTSRSTEKDRTAFVTEFDVNGLKVIVKRRAGAPTVAAGLFFRGGSRNVSADDAGIESFALNVATEASKNFPRALLRKELARAGTSIGSGANYDYSVLSLACTTKNFPASWRIFVDVALNPTFATADVERVREALLTGLRSASDSPEGHLETLNERVIYAGHPYSRQPGGSIENVTRFTAADLAAYYSSLLQTSRMLLVVVGDLDPQTLRQQVAESLGKVPRGSYKEKPVPPIEFARPTINVESKSGAQTNYIIGTFAAPTLDSPDYYAMRAAISALATRVFQEVRAKRNLSYDPTAEMNLLAANTATISATSVNPNEAVRIMLAEMKDLRENPLDAETLKELSGFFLTTYFLKQETNAAQAAELAQYELLGGGWRNSLVFLDRVRGVTAAEVQAAARKYMRNVRFSVVGNPADVDRAVFLQNGN